MGAGALSLEGETRERGGATKIKSFREDQNIIGARKRRTAKARKKMPELLQRDAAPIFKRDYF